MLLEGRRQWIKKFLGGMLGLMGLTTLSSAISSEEAHAITRSVLPNSTMQPEPCNEQGPCNFTCTYCPNGGNCPTTCVTCVNCHGGGTFTCSQAVGIS